MLLPLPIPTLTMFGYKSRRRMLSSWLFSSLLVGAIPAAAVAQSESDQTPHQGPRVERDARPGERLRARRQEGETAGRHSQRDIDQAGGNRMGRLGRFMEFVSNYQDTVADPYQATGFALLGIQDHYRKLGKPLDAVPVLQKVLADTRDQRMRNIVLYHLRQIYERAGNDEQFLAVSQQIVNENIRAIQSDSRN
ncbi:MAG: hypothetical protein KDD44_05590 [Bdellovibrionales bacterium]|nr:hypothetical protein [Bdellovibrionales bacterium]